MIGGLPGAEEILGLLIGRFTGVRGLFLGVMIDCLPGVEKISWRSRVSRR